MASQSAIIWPLKFSPGETDNYVSNEVITKGITAGQIWALLDDITKWESYYLNCGQITEPESGPMLEKGDVFKFATFGFPPLACRVEESVAPGKGAAGRLAWSTDTGEGVAIYHAWLVEDLEGGRVRILTQESQIGAIFREWAGEVPNKMLLGHQDWLDGLVKTARGQKVDQTNLKSVGFPQRA